MSKRSRKLLGFFLAGIGLALVGIQFVPVDRSNPPITLDVGAPAAVGAVLRRSCYDCHSNEVMWPWYSHIAPVSWLLAKHVREGREHLNFSTWDQYSPKKRAHFIEEAFEEASEGHMPLPNYLYLHSDARLTPEDLDLLRQWAADNKAIVPAADVDHKTEGTDSD